MVNSVDESEKREYPRAPIELKVEYRRLNTFFADYTKNISRGGTFIKTQKPLKIGTAFIFKLFVPTLENPIQLTGTVRWIIKPGQENPGEQAGMGIGFTYKEKAEREAVESVVEKLMIDSLGKHLHAKLLKRNSTDPPEE